MTSLRSSILIVTLVFGVLFFLLYASADLVLSATPAVVNVVMPEGAGLADSGENFEPETIMVVIGVNNTVRWINEDVVSSSIVADDKSDPDFYDVTHEDNARSKVFLDPGETFEFTFTKPGEFGYHSEPHPWMRGTVIVLPPGESG